MATNGTSAFDPVASYARLSERVEGQGRDIVDLRSNMNTGFRNIESSITSLSNELRGNSRTQWPVIWSAVGVCFAVIVGIGSAVYIPIREGITEVKSETSILREGTVSRQEMDWRAARGTEDRDRTNNAISDLRENAVTRNEWQERNRARDQEVADLSRRIEEIRAILGSQYTTRDVLLNLQAEVKDLMRRRDTYPGDG